MRCIRVVVGVVCLLLGMAALAQADTEMYTSKLRSVLDTRGALLVTEYSEIGEITAEGGVTVQFDAMAVTVYAPQPQQVKGILVTLTQPAQDEEATAATAAYVADEEDDFALGTSAYLYIDQDEIDALSRAIPKIIELAGIWEDGKREQSAHIKTRDDLSIGVSHFSGFQMTSIMGYDGANSVTAIFKTPQHLLTVKGYLDKGLRQLTTMK